MIDGCCIVISECGETSIVDRERPLDRSVCRLCRKLRIRSGGLTSLPIARRHGREFCVNQEVRTAIPALQHLEHVDPDKPPPVGSRSQQDNPQIVNQVKNAWFERIDVVRSAA
jgi:hypothetical protein